MYSEFSAKELYEVSLKATNNMRINNQDFERDEVFLYFDKIQIASVIPQTSIAEASGGKNNFSWLLWDNLRQVDFIFEHGLMNFPLFNVLSQSRAFNSGTNNVEIPRREAVISNSSGVISLDYAPVSTRAIFIYEVAGGIIIEKITPVGISGTNIDLGATNASKSFLVDYYFLDDEVKFYEIGGENITGFFKMTSKINMIDEKDGSKTTALFVLPSVRIVSNIDMTFGIRANPIVSSLRIRAFPDSSGKVLARLIYLNQDIEG